MENKVNLLGIVRNTSNVNSPAGACQEIINMRKKHGSWRPIMPKTVITNNLTETSNKVFIHSMDNVSYFVVYNPADGTVKVSDFATFALVETIATLGTGLNIRFDSLGYYLIINDVDGYKKYIFRCYPDLPSKYKNISDIPEINVTFSTEITDYSDFQYAKKENDSFQSEWWVLEDKIRDVYPEYFEGFVFVKYAIELIDGSMLKHSSPMFLYVGNVTGTLMEMFLNLSASLCRVHYLIHELPANWSTYSDIIRGITIFMTKPVSKYDLSLSGFNNAGQYLGLVEKPNLLIELFRNESIYYQVHHIAYNKITANGTGIIGEGKPISTPTTSLASGAHLSSKPMQGTIIGRDSYRDFAARENNRLDQLAQYESQANRVDFVNPALFNVNDITSYDALNVDDVSHHTILGIKSLNYNNRLFFSDIYTKLYSGFRITDIIKPGGNMTVDPYDIHIEVDIATEYGLKTVRQTISGYTDAEIIIPYIFGYPDMRANEIRIINTAWGSYKKITFSLEAHPILNFAFATKINGNDMTEAAKDSTGYMTFTTAAFNVAATLKTINDSYRDKNRVQLTDLFNPYATPAANSYQVGEGEIIAMAVNMLPLEDKFGTYPVFVFSTRGIWALNLSDSGSVIVANIVPISSSVCINADSIVVVDNSLIFLASDGIKILNKQTPSEISEIAEGPFTSVLAGNSVYEQVKAHAQIGVVTGLISSVDILKYSENAKFAFDKNNREIIVSNYGYNYSYIYSLNENLWFKSSHRFRAFINHYPNMYALTTGNDLVNIAEEQTGSSTPVPVYIETKPIMIDPDKEVKIIKTVLGGMFDMVRNYYGSFMLYGSNDGVQWSAITGKEINDHGIYNITLPRLPFSLRYIILVFSGTVTKDSVITEIRVVI